MKLSGVHIAVLAVLGVAATVSLSIAMLAYLTPTPRPETASARAPIATPARAAATTKPVTPAPARPPTTWTTLKEWRGSGMKQTETFSTTQREWRITWRASKEAFPWAGIIQVYVYDDGGDLISLAANHQGVGQDESYVRSPPGRHYLMIGSANLSWHAKVEEYR